MAAVTSETRLGELMLYVMQRAVDDPSVDATKLKTLLYYSEFQHFRIRGQAISGVPYVRLPNGPCPNRHDEATNTLIRVEAAALMLQDYLGREQHRLVQLRAPQLDVLDGVDLRVVDAVVEDFWAKSAIFMSDYSHKEAGLRAVEVGDEIPFATALLPRTYKLTSKQRAAAAARVAAALN